MPPCWESSAGHRCDWQSCSKRINRKFGPASWIFARCFVPALYLTRLTFCVCFHLPLLNKRDGFCQSVSERSTHRPPYSLMAQNPQGWKTRPQAGDCCRSPPYPWPLWPREAASLAPSPRGAACASVLGISVFWWLNPPGRCWEVAASLLSPHAELSYLLVSHWVTQAGAFSQLQAGQKRSWFLSQRKLAAKEERHGFFFKAIWKWSTSAKRVYARHYSLCLSE